MIYEHLAGTEERIVLGRRFVDAHKADKELSLDQCFDKAVALHPLSMTCRQMRDEFQNLHFSDPDPKWVLVVNDFNIQQLSLFYDYLDSEEFFKWPSDCEHGDSLTWPPESIIRFQMDNEAVRSMVTLCEHLRNHYVPSSGNEEGSISEHMLLRLRNVEVFTQYHNRTTAPEDHRKNMLPGEGLVGCCSAKGTKRQGSKVIT